MRKREIGSLLLKVGAIFILFQAAPSLVYVIGFTSTFVGATPMWGKLVSLSLMVALPLIWIGICVWLLRNSEKLSQKLFPEDSDCGQTFGLSFTDAQALAYNIIGILTVLGATPHLVKFVTSLMVQYRLPHIQRDIRFFHNWLPSLVAYLVQFAAGAALFLRARGLASLWQKLQQLRPLGKDTG